MKGWYGFDLDSSIARYEGWEGHTDIGEPLGIEKMNSAFTFFLDTLNKVSAVRFYGSCRT